MVPNPAARTTSPMSSRLVRCLDGVGGAGVGQVGAQHHRLDVVRGAQFRGEGVQPVLVAGDEDDVDSLGGDAAGQRLADPVAGPGDQRPRPVPVCVPHAGTALAGWAGSTASTKNAPTRHTAAAVRQPACRPDMNASLTVSRTAPATDGGDWAATCRPWARPSRAVA